MCCFHIKAQLSVFANLHIFIFCPVPSCIILRLISEYYYFERELNSIRNYIKQNKTRPEININKATVVNRCSKVINLLRENNKSTIRGNTELIRNTNDNATHKETKSESMRMLRSRIKKRDQMKSASRCWIFRLF